MKIEIAQNNAILSAIEVEGSLEEKHLKIIHNKLYTIGAISIIFSEATLFLKTFKNIFNNFKVLKTLCIGKFYWLEKRYTIKSQKPILLIRSLPRICPNLSELMLEVDKSIFRPVMKRKIIPELYTLIRDNFTWSSSLKLWISLEEFFSRNVKQSRGQDFVLSNVGKFCKAFTLSVARKKTAYKNDTDTVAKKCWREMCSKLFLAAGAEHDKRCIGKKDNENVYAISDLRFKDTSEATDLATRAQLFNLDRFRLY